MACGAPAFTSLLFPQPVVESTSARAKSAPGTIPARILLENDEGVLTKNKDRDIVFEWYSVAKF
jgi:hypothetical protein